MSDALSGFLRRTAGWLLFSFVIGLAIGALTLGGQAVLPDSFGRLANSGAVWVIAAYVLGRFARSWRLAALAGFVALAGEILGYYVAASFWMGAYSASAFVVIGYWFVVALVAGPLFGAAGYVSRNGHGWQQVLATAALGAVFIGEGLYLYVVLVDVSGLVWLGLGAIATLLLALRAPRRVQTLFATMLLGLVFFGGELFLVWLDSMRATLFQG